MEPLVSKQYVLKTYEEIAEGVDERRQTPWADVAGFEKSLPRGQTVLDAGCGTGRNALHYAMAGHKVMALDFSRNLLKKTVKRTSGVVVRPRVNVIQGDVAALPVKGSSVDACIYIATLHHLPTGAERLQSLRELFRCLKPGGRMLVSVWVFEQQRFHSILKEHQEKKEGFGDVLVPIRTRGGKVIQRFYHLFVEKELDQILLESGFEIERCFKSHDNYFAVAVRPHRN